MSTHQFNFKAGYLEQPRDFPSISSLENTLSDSGIIGDAGNREWVRQVHYNERQELLYFIFIKEVPSTMTVFDEERRGPGEEEVFPLRTMKVVLGARGNFVYESVQGVSPQEAIDFISEMANLEDTVEAERYQALNRKLMLNFYNNYLDIVKRFKVENIGKREPNPGPIPSELRDILDTYGDVIDNSEHSVGRQDKDARQDNLAHAFAETSEVQYVRGKDEDGRTQELTQTGIFRTRYDEEEMAADEEANFIVSKISEVFGEMFDGND